jgi:uncharacterized repeat protein (TIGR03943 family)
MKTRVRASIAALSVCLPAIVYIFWLNAYYWLLEGGRYEAFIQPKLWPLLILALLFLLMFIAAFIYQYSRNQRHTALPDIWIKSAVFFVPVVFLWAIYGQSLGGYAFSKRVLNPDEMVSVPGTYKIPPFSKSTAENRLTLLDLVKDAEIFDGKRVTAEGMVYRAPDLDENTFMLFRFAIVCCAADAIPVGILVKHTDAGRFTNDAWVRVAGQLHIETVNVRHRPIIDADTVRQIPIPIPQKRYLFF